VIFFVFSAAILVSLIPVFIGNKRIEKEEDYIFDLMTSIAPELIEQDIIDLADL
jgi:hypothetical protein